MPPPLPLPRPTPLLAHILRIKSVLNPGVNGRLFCSDTYLMCARGLDRNRNRGTAPPFKFNSTGFTPGRGVLLFSLALSEWGLVQAGMSYMISVFLCCFFLFFLLWLLERSVLILLFFLCSC